MLQYGVLVLNTQQQSDNGGGDIVADELPAGALDWVAILGVKLMRGTEPDTGGDGGTVDSSQGCGCTLCAVGGGEGETLSQGTHNGGGGDVLGGCGCCLHNLVFLCCY